MNYGEMVKYTRLQLSLSQEQLARELNISFSTINRWENEKSRPSPMAKALFFSYCKEKGIDLNQIQDEGGIEND